MIGKSGKMLLASVMAWSSVGAGQALAQGQPLPPTPVPVAPGGQLPPPPPPGPGPLTPPGGQVPSGQFPPPPPQALAPLTPPPLGPVYPPPPAPPGVIFHDNRDQWALHKDRQTQAPGFFGILELDVIGPSITGTLSAPVTIGAYTNNTALSSAELNTTGSPNITLGYRFGENLGAFVVNYRSIVSQGSCMIPYDVSDAYLKTRLNMNIVDLDYLSSKIDIAPCWDLEFRVGARIAAIYYDNQATGTVLSEQTSNNFVGAGPHFGFELARQLDLVPGLSMFGRLDGAFVIGNQTQSFDTVFTLSDGSQYGGATRLSQAQTSPVVTFMAGLSYSTPGNRHWLRFDFGYLFEQWWAIGNNGNSSGEIQLNGVFFRGAFNY